MRGSSRAKISILFTSINGIECSIGKKHGLLVKLASVGTGISRMTWSVTDLANSIGMGT